jgi:hypothetical protein
MEEQMSARRTHKSICCAILIVAGMAGARSGQAANVAVQCGGGADEDSYQSISAALSHLDPRGPNTVTVSGSCQENLSITYFNRLTLNANPGASISDASGGKSNVIAITDSQTVIFNGFTINGGVVCQTVSTCAFFGDTFRNAPGDGVAITDTSYAVISGSTITDNPSGRGLLVAGGSHVNASGITVRSNGASGFSGIRVVQSAVLLLANSTIANNGRDGIAVTDHSSLHSTDNTVTENANNGISLASGSEARFTAITTGNVIGGNGNYGVLIADLSLGNNETAGNSTSGNHTTTNAGQPDVQCVGKSPAGVGVALKSGTVSSTCGP